MSWIASVVSYLLAASALAVACDSTDTFRAGTGRPNAIVDGEPTGYEQYQAAVMVTAGGIRCTGTLIHPRVVLTAAHCIYSRDLGNDTREHPERVVVSGGSQGDGFLGSVDEIEVHPRWDGTIAMDASDLAMLRIAAPILGIEPAILRDYPGPEVGEDAVIVGYGHDPGSDASAPLHRRGETVLLQISPYIFETGGATNTCTGDSGGPLFTAQGGRWAVTGVTSFGASDCDAEDQGYSVNILTYCGWINNVMIGFVGDDLGLDYCKGCAPVPAKRWGQACGPGYPCCPENTACRTPDEFSSSGLGYCAPECCAFGQADEGVCTDVTGGREHCGFVSDFEGAFCAISCDDDDDCVAGTRCKNRPFSSDRICIATEKGTDWGCGDVPASAESDETQDTDSGSVDTDAPDDGGSGSGCLFARPTPSVGTVDLLQIFLGW